MANSNTTQDAANTGSDTNQNQAKSGSGSKPAAKPAEKPKTDAKPKMVDAIEVKTAHGVTSFWRDGIKFGNEVKTIVLSDLKEAEIKAIKEEKKLVHKLVQIEQAVKEAL